MWARIWARIRAMMRWILEGFAMTNPYYYVWQRQDVNQMWDAIHTFSSFPEFEEDWDEFAPVFIDHRSKNHD